MLLGWHGTRPHVCADLDYYSLEEGGASCSTKGLTHECTKLTVMFKMHKHGVLDMWQTDQLWPNSPVCMLMVFQSQTLTACTL